MDIGGAYGGGKAGGAFDLIAFVTRPTVILRAVCWMSSVKTRKHYVLADLGFSAFWSFLFFIGFCYLTNQWGKADDPPNGEGVNNVQASIVFSFFSIFTWAGCAYFAFLRFKAGVDPSFQSTYDGLFSADLLNMFI
uniref:Uncharacterized protein n=1 Tax=Anopheles atroparvus TaxID=41427 RepID=A0A182IXJ2_ANOAO